MKDLDPRLTFDTFVVGPSNRLACAAARRAAESPGTSYNPLFLYSASGLGKSHILGAVAQHCLKQRPDRVIVYQTLEGYLDELARALEQGGQDAMRSRYLKLDVLLLDDVQFLTGQAQAQEMLLRTLDALTGRNAQIVLASDRPPAEINGLDARLLSRFSGGLIVDMGPPDFETRVAIIRRKAEDRKMTLAGGVPEAMARFPFKNVRELQGALNRLLAIQDLEGRPVTVDDLPGLLGERAAETGTDVHEMIEGLGESEAPEAGGGPQKDEPWWRKKIRMAAAEAEEEGFSAQRIARLLEEDSEPSGWEDEIRRYQEDVARARAMKKELHDLGNPWPEAAATLLRDPDRLEEAEALLGSARERARPFPAIGKGPGLDDLSGRYPALALRAAARLVRAGRPDYNPLYLHTPDGARALGILEAAGRTFLDSNPKGIVALVSVPEFAEEFIRAISEGVAGAWRERWWGVELLLLHGIEGLSDTERAQDEFFHLFEALIRRGGRILLAADRAPSKVKGVDDRLLSRFEGGLVVELGDAPEAEEAGDRSKPGGARATAGGGAAARPAVERAAPAPTPPPAHASAHGPTSEGGDDLAAVREMAGVARGPKKKEGEGDHDLVVTAPVASDATAWFPSPEKVVWEWPLLEELLVEEAE